MVLVSRPSCASLFLVANFVPHHLTLTVNKGETVHLSMQLLGSEKRDVTWKYNGRLSKTEERVESSKENNNCISTGFPRFFLAFKKKTLVFLCAWCRKLLLHDSLERNGQFHCSAHSGEHNYCQSRHLQRELHGGHPSPRGLDEAYCSRLV